jgi:hypothetical protein
MRRLLPAALLFIALLLAPPLWAEQIGTPASGHDESQSLAADEQPPRWQFEFMPYLWLGGSFGSVQVKGRTATIDATIGDLLTLLWHGDAFAFGGYFAARYDRWSAFVDAYGGFENVGSSVRIPTRACGCLQVGATADLRPVILDVALGYELGEWSLPERRQPISLGVYLGTRYVYLGTTLNVEGGILNGTQRARQVASSLNIAAPLIGVRWEVPLLDSLSLDFRSDLGGIPGNSQLTWGLVSDVRYRLGWAPFGSQTWLAAGYKVVAFQHDFGGGTAVDLQLRGPLLAMGFTF